MRSRSIVVFAAFALAACSDNSVAPTVQVNSAPIMQASQIGGDPAKVDLCGGLSPCDAYDYRGDGSIGAPGICFLPPSVDNHLSDPACSAPNRPGLSGIFKLAWCRVIYSDPTGATPPTIAKKANGVDDDCLPQSDWKPLIEDNGHYATSVQWKKNQAKDGDMFRLYLVRGNQMFAHRDVVINPNYTTPADAFVHAIGNGAEQVKVLISEDFSCIKYDTQLEGTDNAATCLIAGETTLAFYADSTGGAAGLDSVIWHFPDGNEAFMANFELSECLSLGFYIDGSPPAMGNALVDTPLANCKISVSSDEVEVLDVPAQLYLYITDPRWSNIPGSEGPFANARFNVIEADTLGVGVLPTITNPGWWGMATSESAALRWLGRGIDKLAALVLPEPLYAAFSTGGLGTNVSRMSDLQVSVMGVMVPGPAGAACGGNEPYCRDLGAFSAGESTQVSVHVSAPTLDGPTTYPANHIDVPDTRLHFFPQHSAVTCPVGSTQDAAGRGCVPANTPDFSTDPPSYWDHVVVVTDTAGIGTVDWIPSGEDTVFVAACGVARMGPSEPSPFGEPGSDHVWGTLGDCSNREVAMTQATYDNGPADGFTPFEPVDSMNEAAIYAPPLMFVARTCPTIVVDGMKDGDEWICATQTLFTAPQKGPKVENNATLYTYSDGQTLYVGIEVRSNDLGNRMFMALTDTVMNGDGVEAPGDELLVLDLGNPSTPLDWHNTQACLGNNSSSLCGDIDTRSDGGKAAAAAAQLDGAGTGRTFYEFSRPLGATLSPKEDLGAGAGAHIGLRLVLTQGSGGGKGGFVFPDPQTSNKKYYTITID